MDLTRLTLIPDPTWLPTSILIPPHIITHPDKLEELYNDFITNGWDTSCKCLRGYWDGEKVQLISGTHRCEAARLTHIMVPVIVWPSREFVYGFWGTDHWDWIMGNGEFKDTI